MRSLQEKGKVLSLRSPDLYMWSFVTIGCMVTLK